MLELTSQEVIIRLVKNPYLAEAVNFAVVFAVHTCFSLTTEGTLNKTTKTNKTYRPRGPMQTQPIERRKRKRRDVFKETTTNYDVPAALRHLKI